MSTLRSSIDRDVVDTVDAIIREHDRTELDGRRPDRPVSEESIKALADAGLGVLDAILGSVAATAPDGDLRRSHGSRFCCVRVDVDRLHDPDALRAPGSTSRGRQRRSRRGFPGSVTVQPSDRSPWPRTQRWLRRRIDANDGAPGRRLGLHRQRQKTFISNGYHADVIVPISSGGPRPRQGRHRGLSGGAADLDGLQGPGASEEAGAEGLVSRHAVLSGLPASRALAARGRGSRLPPVASIRHSLQDQRRRAGSRLRAGGVDGVVRWAAAHDLLSSRTGGAQDLQFELARLRGEISAARALFRTSPSNRARAARRSPLRPASSNCRSWAPATQTGGRARRPIGRHRRTPPARSRLHGGTGKLERMTDQSDGRPSSPSRQCTGSRQS